MVKKAALFFVIAALAAAVVMALLYGHTFAVLQPMGYIADKQHRLFLFAALLSLVALIPTFTMAALIAVKYRATNQQAEYAPNWDFNLKLSLSWWLLIGSVITVLGIVAWQTTHELDPYRAIASDTKPMTIQVIALQWKWLFLYPDQNIATVNYVSFPEDTPINFELTADAPMNSFWIPQLGGQIYAMEGMTTKLHLMADGPGEYNGVNAEISGEDFAAMRFKAVSRTKEDFNNWIMDSRTSSRMLTMHEYNRLAEPETQGQKLIYSTYQSNLFDSVVAKFMPAMDHSAETTQPTVTPTHDMSGMDHDMPGM